MSGKDPAERDALPHRIRPSQHDYDSYSTQRPYSDQHQQPTPFSRFKSFIDTNLSTLSSNILNFPTNISDLKARMQAEREARRAEEADISYTWTGSEDSPDHIRMTVERQSQAAKNEARCATEMLLKEAWTRSQDVPAQKVMDLYRDNEWSFGGLDHFANPMLSAFGGACYYKAETVENLPSTARWGWPTRAPQWLSVDWFKRSPYSPVRLGKEPAPFNTDSHWNDLVWRAAFEELLCATLGKPMNSCEKMGMRPPFGKTQSTHYGPGLDWMLSLQCRGILPPQLPSLYRRNDDRSGSLLRDCWPLKEIISRRAGEERDFQALLEEVSIRPSPGDGVEPILNPYSAINPIIREACWYKGRDAAAAAAAAESCPVSDAWQVPDTEEELYAHIFGSTESAAESEDPVTKALIYDLFDAMQVLKTVMGEPITDASARPTAEEFYSQQMALPDTRSMTKQERQEFFAEALRQRKEMNEHCWEAYSAAFDELNAALKNHDIDRAQQLIRQWNYGSWTPRLDTLDAIHSGEHDARDAALLDSALKAYSVARSDELHAEGDFPRLSAMSIEGRNALMRLLEKKHTLLRDEVVDMGSWCDIFDLYRNNTSDADFEAMIEEVQKKEKADGSQKVPAKTPLPPSAVDGAHHPVASKESSILAQLTTTETTRRPDGTITTRVVMKQRFADGTEQDHESLQTYYPEEEKSDVKPSKHEKDAKKPGWFWS